MKARNIIFRAREIKTGKLIVGYYAVLHLPEFDKDNPDRIHLTQKPVALYAWLLKNYAKPGDRIFDPMMGSQSSRIAAYKMGFDYVGCELDAEYFAKGNERFDRECLDIRHTEDGKTITQLHLFE